MPNPTRRTTLQNITERVLALEGAVALLSSRYDELERRIPLYQTPITQNYQDTTIPNLPPSQFSSSSITLNNPPSPPISAVIPRPPSSTIGLAPNSPRGISPQIYFTPAIHRACLMETSAFDELRGILCINPVLERIMTMLRHLHITIRGFNDIADLMPMFSTELGHGVQRAMDSYNILLELIEHPSGALALPDTAINFIYPIPAIPPPEQTPPLNFSPIIRPLPIPPLPEYIPRVPINTLADSLSTSPCQTPDPIGTGRPTFDLPGARPPTRSRTRMESSEDEQPQRSLRRETRRVRPRRIPVPRTDTPIPHLSGPGVPPLGTSLTSWMSDRIRAIEAGEIPASRPALNTNSPRFNPDDQGHHSPIVFGDFSTTTREDTTEEAMRRIFDDNDDEL